jgi:hypothetical protein
VLRDSNDQSYGYLRTKNVPLMRDERLSSEPRKQPIVKMVGEMVLAGIAIHVGAAILKSGSSSILKAISDPESFGLAKTLPTGFRKYATELLEFDKVLETAEGIKPIVGGAGSDIITKLRLDDLLNPEGATNAEYVRRITLSRAIGAARRMPYELPAAYITTKALFDREQTKKDIQEGKFNPLNPVDVIGDFAIKSAQWATADLAMHLAAPMAKVMDSWLTKTSPAYTKGRMLTQLVGQEASDMLVRSTDQIIISKTAWDKTSERLRTIETKSGGQVADELATRKFVTSTNSLVESKGKSKMAQRWEVFKEERAAVQRQYRDTGMRNWPVAESPLTEELRKVGGFEDEMEKRHLQGVYKERVAEKLVGSGWSRDSADLAVQSMLESNRDINISAATRYIVGQAEGRIPTGLSGLRGVSPNLYRNKNLLSGDSDVSQIWENNILQILKSKKLPNKNVTFDSFDRALRSALPGDVDDAKGIVGLAKSRAIEEAPLLRKLAEWRGSAKILVDPTRRGQQSYQALVARRAFTTLGHGESIANLNDKQLSQLWLETVGGRATATEIGENILVAKGEAARSASKLFNVFGLRRATIGDMLAINEMDRSSPYGRRGRMFTGGEKPWKKGIQKLEETIGRGETHRLLGEKGLYLSATGKLVDFRNIVSRTMVGITGLAKSTQIPILKVNVAGLFGVSTLLESRGPGVRTMSAAGGLFVQEELKDVSRHAPMFQIGKQLYGRTKAGELTNFGRWTMISSSRTSMGAKYARVMTGMPHTPQGEWDTSQRKVLGNKGFLKWFDIEQDTSKSIPHNLWRRLLRGKDPNYIVNAWSSPEYGLGSAILKSSGGRGGAIDFAKVSKVSTIKSAQEAEGIFEYVHDVMSGPKSKRSVNALFDLARGEGILPAGMSQSSSLDELQAIAKEATESLKDPTLTPKQRTIQSNTIGKIQGMISNLTSKSVNETVMSGGTRAGGGLATTTGLQAQQQFLQFYMQKAAFVSGDGGRTMLDALEKGARELYQARGIDDTIYNEIRSQFAASRMRISQGIGSDLLGMTNEVQEILGRRYGPGGFLTSKMFTESAGGGFSGLVSLMRYSVGNRNWIHSADAIVQDKFHTFNPFIKSKWIAMRSFSRGIGLESGFRDIKSILLDRPLMEDAGASSYPLATAMGLLFKPNDGKIPAQRTTGSIAGWHLISRVVDSFETVGLGVNKWKYGSPASLLGAVMTKRIAPGYVAGAMVLPLIMGLPLVGADGIIGAAGFAAGPGMGQARSQAMSMGNIVQSNIAQIPIIGPGLASFIPSQQGASQWAAAFDSDEDAKLRKWSRTPEEEREFWKSGVSPVRAGRWWLLGNNPWRGSKVSYYKPNWYRMMKSQYQYTDDYRGTPMEWAMFGSDLSPLKYTDPYHYENKWGDTRPYPVSGEAFTGPWGPLRPLLNMTIGNVIKPRIRMHEGEEISQQDYLLMQETKFGTSGQQGSAIMSRSTGGKMGVYSPRGIGDRSSSMISGAMQMAFGSNESISSGEQYGGISSTGEAPMLAASMAYGSSRQPSSGTSVIEILNRIQADKRAGRPTVAVGGGTGYSTGKGTMSPSKFMALVPFRKYQYSRLVPNSDMAKSPTDPFINASLQLGELGYSIQEWSGIYGFMAQTARTKLGYGEKEFTPGYPILEGAQRAYGSQRMFWEKNFGGLGDINAPGLDANLQISEITRRFIPKERNLKSVNRIPNRMPSWLPGADYFVDFKVGDPFMKVPLGEARLPGEGYKRLNKLHPDEVGEYGAFDRFKILADVAPWSLEYSLYQQMMTKTDLSPAMRKEAADIKRQVAERKKKRTFHAKMWNGKLASRTIDGLAQVSITDAASGQSGIDPNLFTAPGVENPLRMAGVRFSKSGTGQAVARDFFNTYIKDRKLEIAYDKEHDVVRNNREKTMDVIIKADGKNLNEIVKRMIDNGIPGVSKATSKQFIDNQILYPKAISTIATGVEKLRHLNIPFVNIKFGRQSADEFYERRMVYGRSWQPWETPYKSFIEPQIDTLTAPNKGILGPIAAGIGVGFLTRMFWTSEQPAMQKAFMIGGAVIGTTLAISRGINSLINGQRWVPRRRRKEWEIDEYADIINYVKWSNLYQAARQAAIDQDGTDPETIISAVGETAAARKRTWQKMWDASPIGQKPNKVAGETSYDNIGPATATALEYRKRMKTTMYGADLFGDPVTLAMAVPKRYRDMFAELEGVEKSRQKQLLDMMPRMMRRMLEARWGRRVEEKPDLTAYFGRHELPPPEWEGWLPTVDMEEVKLKIIKNEGVDASELGYYPNEIENAAQAPWAFPQYDTHTPMSRDGISQQLEAMGVRDIQMSLERVPIASSGFDFDLVHDRRNDIRRYVTDAI